MQKQEDYDKQISRFTRDQNSGNNGCQQRKSTNKANSSRASIHDKISSEKHRHGTSDEYKDPKLTESGVWHKIQYSLLEKVCSKPSMSEP